MLSVAWIQLEQMSYGSDIVHSEPFPCRMGFRLAPLIYGFEVDTTSEHTAFNMALHMRIAFGSCTCVVYTACSLPSTLEYWPAA